MLKLVADSPLAGPRHVQRRGAECPGEQQPQGAEQQRPRDPVDAAHHHPSGQHPRPNRLGDALHQHRERGSDQQPAYDRDQRGIGRLTALREERGAEPSAQDGSENEPGQREGACDQSTLVTDHREGDREDRDD